MIDLAILKTHDRNGITVTAKNHFGSFLRTPDPGTANYYNLHGRLPMQGTWGQAGSMAQYRPLVDLNGHAGMGGKTVLYLLDGIYGGWNWLSAPTKWNMAPFNDDWPSSFFLSMDQVAIDSVAFDILSQQWPEHALANEGVQDYLHEMALANNPPSGTFYDPEGDGSRLASMGVHEHWNNPVEKKYTRNLGTGNGIELVMVSNAPAPAAAVCGSQVDFRHQHDLPGAGGRSGDHHPSHDSRLQRADQGPIIGGDYRRLRQEFGYHLGNGGRGYGWLQIPRCGCACNPGKAACSTTCR